MRVTIGLKVFGIAVGLLLLMAVVALLSLRMTRIVDDQLVIVDQNYFPAYVALAQANIRSVEESAYVRRLLLALGIPCSSQLSVIFAMMQRTGTIIPLRIDQATGKLSPAGDVLKLPVPVCAEFLG